MKILKKCCNQTHVHDLLSSVNRVTPLCAAKLQTCTDTLSVFDAYRCNLRKYLMKILIKNPHSK